MLWPLCHGPGDADTLLLPAGEFIRPIKRALEQTNPFERLQGDEAIRPRQRKHGPQGAVRADAAEQNVLERREAADQMMLLEDHSGASAVFA